MPKITYLPQIIIKKTLKLSVFETKILVLLLLGKNTKPLKAAICNHNTRLLKDDKKLIKNLLNTGLFEYLSYDKGDWIYKIKKEFTAKKDSIQIDLDAFLRARKKATQTMHLLACSRLEQGWVRLSPNKTYDIFGNGSIYYKDTARLIKEKIKPALEELKKTTNIHIYKKSHVDCRGIYLSFNRLEFKSKKAPKIAVKTYTEPIKQQLSNDLIKIGVQANEVFRAVDSLNSKFIQAILYKSTSKKIKNRADYLYHVLRREANKRYDELNSSKIAKLPSYNKPDTNNCFSLDIKTI